MAIYAFRISRLEFISVAVVPTGFTINDSRTVTVVEKPARNLIFGLAMTVTFGGCTDSDGRRLPDIFMALQRELQLCHGFMKSSEAYRLMDDMILLHPTGDYLVRNHLGPSLARPIRASTTEPVRCRRRNHSPTASALPITSI